ncbi:chemotaxis protein [Erwinia sp. S43]|uniref:chemotaxis protein n=1 Tax=unclassified Erwinia TaxID=2622719 RepID=UPI00190D3C3D|nr:MULTISPECIES: chemotaxis protein [unclassified Erwinia]MBK0032080.1 chemotaxis protein [Erwinia sp. S43]MCW1876859.1 chemotaxis protein [Erwinia sp. INIA01]
MALPFIILGVAAAASAFGGKKAYDGYQKKSEADKMLASAKSRYENREKHLEYTRGVCTDKLNALGMKELAIGKDFDEFNRVAKELLARLQKEGHKDLKLSIPQHSISKMQNLAISATEYMTTVLGAGASGAAAGFAVYGGVMAFAAASTGTPIAALSGAAAYNATMAAIGGGSLAAGGWGMAGGAMVLGGAVVAPLIAIAGWAYDSHADKALENARKSVKEADKAVEKMSSIIKKLVEVRKYAESISLLISEMHDIFTEHYFAPLKEMHQRIIASEGTQAKAADGLSEDIIRTIGNGYKLAAIMADVITTPLFKPMKTSDGEAVIENGAIKLKVDSDGMNVLNNDELDAALQQSGTDFVQFQINA